MSSVSPTIHTRAPAAGLTLSWVQQRHLLVTHDHLQSTKAD